jgi:protein TonB
VSENRFLQSFSALLASAILVCGTQLLLIASQEYGRPDLEPALAPMEASVPSSAPVPARESIDVEITGATETRSHPNANHFAGDQASLSPAPTEVAPASEPNAEISSAPPQTADASTSPTAASPRIEEFTSPWEVAEVVPTNKVEQPAPAETRQEAAPAQPPEETTPPPQAADAVPTPKTAEAAPAQQADDVAPTEEKEVEPTQEVGNKSVTSGVEPVAPETPLSETPKPSEPVATAKAEETAPNAPQVAEAKEVATPTPAPVVDEPDASSTSKLAEAESTSKAPETAKADPVVANVPLPTRKPKVVAAKPIAPRVEPEAKEATVEPKPRWTPMALAPADKDIVAKPQLEPKRAESASGYNATIWSALARHKPRAGKAGSAVVTFAIGPAGALRSARISGSSGDARLDQMALQTVRSAAPFPPPPNPASASYTIRIYFR